MVGIDIRLGAGQDLSLFSKFSRPYLASTQSPIESLLEAFLTEQGDRGVKHSPSVARLIIETGGGHL